MSGVLAYPSAGGVRSHRFTADEYLRMADQGYFLEQRVELIEGQILDVSPQQPAHRLAVTRCFRLAVQAYDDPSRFFVLCQATLRLGEDLPEPDLYVLPCPEGVDEASWPLPLWVLEIADRSYAYDIGPKLELYARAGIGEYLVLDLQRRRLEVHRQPRQENGRWRYSSRLLLGEQEAWSPQSGPRVTMPVSRMLP